MIQSGRTRSVQTELEVWYDRERKEADTEWLWGFNVEAVRRLLKEREAVPFRSFFVRYLLAVHRQEMEPYFQRKRPEEWLEESAEELLSELEESGQKSYEASSERIRALVDLVFDDFVSNGFYEKEEGSCPKHILGSVNQKVPRTGKKGLFPVLWDKDALLKKISAKYYTTKFTKERGFINKDEFFAFAFGLHMAYEDISYILRKAFRRSDFNLWDDREFLLYVTFRYADGDLAAFYEKLQEAYLDDSLPPRKGDWQKEDFTTRSIAQQTKAIAGLIRRENYAFALDEEGRLAKELLEYLQEYKYLRGNSEDYQRTAQRESERLLLQFAGNVEEDVKEWREAFYRDSEESELEKYAEGDVILEFDPAQGLMIPKGTRFFKYDSKSGGKLEFYTLEETRREPSSEAVMDVELNVCRTEMEKKRRTSQEQDSYVAGKSSFRTDHPYLKGSFQNKSSFKAPTKAKVGENVFVSGKLFGKCLMGKTVKKGTRFFTEGKAGGELVFVLEKDVNARCTERIRIRCREQGKEALKNEIIDCEIENWKERFQSISNTKISLKKAEPGMRRSSSRDGERELSYLHEYLYQPHRDAYELLGGVDAFCMEKLSSVLEGTMLSSTKLSQIRRKKERHISRNDLLTLCFLSYMSEVEKARGERTAPAEEDYMGRYGGFLLRTNEILRKCGFYELYAPNPYDSLLVLLISSNEGVAAYRNLWSVYLTMKEKGEEKDS